MFRGIRKPGTIVGVHVKFNTNINIYIYIHTWYMVELLLRVLNLCEVNWHGTDSQPIEAGKIHDCEAAF